MLNPGKARSGRLPAESVQAVATLDGHALDILLVISCAVCDVKIIASAGVILQIDFVECKGDLRQDIGADGFFLPGGIDFAGGNVFNLILKADGHIFRGLVLRARMHGDRFRDVGEWSFIHFGCPPKSAAA